MDDMQRFEKHACCKGTLSYSKITEISDVSENLTEDSVSVIS